MRNEKQSLTRRFVYVIRNKSSSTCIARVRYFYYFTCYLAEVAYKHFHQSKNNWKTYNLRLCVPDVLLLKQDIVKNLVFVKTVACICVVMW